MDLLCSILVIVYLVTLYFWATHVQGSCSVTVYTETCKYVCGEVVRLACCCK